MRAWRARRAKTFKLIGADHFVAHEHVGHAAPDENLRFGDFLATHADRAARDLLGRDDGRLVRFGMRTQPYAKRLSRVRHRIEIALECIEIDQKGRCIDSG